MPNEIYHKSNWGNANAEGFGDVYFDAAATNKLYNHSDYYENSNGTDKILRDLSNKASIVLTPTAYSDGSLNTVIPPYQILPQELVTNGGFDTDSDWTKETGWTISNGVASHNGVAGAIYQINNSIISGKTYKLSLTVLNVTSGTLTPFVAGTNSNLSITQNGSYSAIVVAGSGSRSIDMYSDATFVGSIDSISIKEIQEADFDFSRGSSATRVNEQGLIEDVQILSGELVQNGNFEQIGSELVTNGGFDTDSNWTAETNVTLTVNDGIANVFSTQAFRGIYQSVSITAGKIYKATIRYKSDDDIRIYVGGSSFSLLSASSNFTTETAYITAAGSSTIYVLPTQPNQTIEIDNVSVKEVGQNWIFFGEAEFTDNGARIYSSSGGQSYINQPLGLTNNKKYRLSYEITDSTTGSLKLINVNGLSDYPIPSTVGTHTLDFIANNPTLFIYRNSGATDVTIDNVSVVEVTNDTDIPRIDYTSGFGSLLLEPQSTNLVPYSEDFSQWDTTQNATLTSDSTISPDGSVNATKITDNSTNGNHRVFTSLTTTSGSNTFSVYLKKGTMTTAFLRFLSGSDIATANVNLEEGTITATTGTAEIQNAGNDWYRCSITGIATAGTSYVYIYMKQLSAYSGTSQDLFLWGAQLEAGSYATSYIVSNSGSATTRSADVANNSGNADLFNDSEGVLYAEIAALADVLSFQVLSISDGGATNSVGFGYRTSSNVIYTFVGSAINSSTSVTVSDITLQNKVAVKYKSGSFAMWINGFEVYTSPTAFTISGISQLSFDNGAGSADFYGKTKELAVFKEALTDAELESLTSWVSFTEMATDLEYTIE